MKKEQDKNILKISSIENEIKKRRENIVSQRRSDFREESLMKKRKEKIYSVTNTSINNIINLNNQCTYNLCDLKEELLSDQISKKTRAATEIRKMLSVEKNPPIQEVINCNMLPIFIELLTYSESEDLQFEAAWILTNIASGTTEQTSEVVRCGAVPIFIKMIEHKNENLKEQSIWALGNIAGDSCKYRDMVLHEKILHSLLNQVNLTNKISFLRNATWTLSNLCRGKPGPENKYLKDILCGLTKLIFSEDNEILGDVCWALSYISDNSNKQIQSIIEAGIVQRIVELLMHKDIHVQTPALRTIGNIVTGDDIQTQLVINCSVLPCLLVLLNSPKKSIKKEACWTISNIAAGNSEQIQAIIDCKLFPTLIYILKNAEVDVKKEAAWALSNAASGGNPDHISYLVKQGCIKPMLDLLNSADNRLTQVLLEAIELILKAGKIKNKDSSTNEYVKIIEQVGGLEKLENLQHHKNNNIYEISLRILEKYFEAEDLHHDSDFMLESIQTSQTNQQIPNCAFTFS
uniref:Importin subunit alpha n=1 Tax=Cryptomonas curvata TaxID=233186 RepID=A0A7S0MHJ0_9CRYP|nr:importin alpha [Cryptomonas curvata]|mmetsp:Transcript_38012/g.79630  ORF Transcript_38012/g.79630 Transcript_38012/m.79630 type:complete len:519 (+) Transcript_38012:45-1601(+)